MLKTTDGTQTKRLPGRMGDRYPTTGFQKKRALYTATGGETSINLSLLTPPLSYVPNNSQIAVKRTSGGGPLIAGIDFYETSVSTIGFPTADPLLAGEIVEIMQDAMVTGIMAVTPSPECYSATATTGQTLITADFSWPYNLNPTKAIGGVLVKINGITQTRYIDYTEVNLGAERTNQVIVTDSFVGGENIILLPAFQAIDTSAAASAFYGSVYSGMQSQIQAGTQAFVDQSTDMISVPNTTIVNRAKIPNIANDLRASLGIERIQTQSIVQLPNEFGSSGEPVYAAINDDRGLIRFVGGWSNNNGGYGPIVLASLTTDYIEITFYGTGLNILYMYIDTSNRGFTYYVDGGTGIPVSVTGSNVFVVPLRNYSPNSIVNVPISVSLGLHTVKIVTTGGTAMSLSGFEILNSNASGLININPGVGYNGGLKYTNTVYDSVAYTTGVTGTKGGRIVRYLNSDGTFSQAFQATDTTALYLANAVHTNEEVARVYSWREFGCGRADDFSLLTPATGRAAAFTLDDGTATLLSNDAIVSSTYFSEGLRGNTASTAFITFTFVGTGLDVEMISFGGTTNTVAIDGGTANALPQQTVRTITKIASGLPYGTHIAKFLRGGSGVAVDFKSFIVYQPKKPTVPSTAIEIADYNVMADYVANTTAGLETIGTGLLRKDIAQREGLYVDGTGGAVAWTVGISVPTNVGAWETYTDKLNAYLQYTFFGTGFDFRYQGAGNRSANVAVTVDSSVLNQTNFSSMIYSNYGGGSFTGGTGGSGVLSLSTTTQGAGFSVKGLPLGLHTVKFNNGTGGSYLIAETLDIITPIHSYKSNLYADLQNTLTVGSNSLMDSRKTSMVEEILPAQKAWTQAVGFGASTVTTSSTSFVPIPGLSTTIKTSGGPLQIITVVDIYYPASLKRASIAIFVDGERVSTPCSPQSFSTAGEGHLNPCVTVIVPVAVGYHKVDVHWLSIDGTTVYSYLDATTNGRMLSVVEL